MRKDRQVEILAPAGSFACFQAAMNAGADAVYAAGARFGARAYANNFTQDELIEAIERAHIYGKKFYLTVNTLLKDHEIAELYDYLAPLYEKGLDAVIVQDTGVFQFSRSNFPDLDIHASTQMTITGAAGAKFLESQGAARVVPARELSLEEVRQIHETTDLEVECFVHGALCYCYSGQCLMSSVIGGRSGNRGQCAQPCRLPYTVDGQKKYFLSLKDICTLELIPELVEAGIDSFKIEGRMKKPEYVAAVTAMYRKYVDLYLKKGKSGYAVKPEDRENLMDLYNRGDSDTGYYKQHNGREMLALDRPNHAGVAAARCLSQNGREVTAQALTDLHAHDVLEIGSGKDNYTLGKKITKGEKLRFLVPKGMRFKEGFVFRRIRNEELIESLDQKYRKEDRQEEIYGFLSLQVGYPASFTVCCREFSYTAYTEHAVEHAQKRPLEEERIRTQLAKTGGTLFFLKDLEISMVHLLDFLDKCLRVLELTVDGRITHIRHLTKYPDIALMTERLARKAAAEPKFRFYRLFWWITHEQTLRCAWERDQGNDRCALNDGDGGGHVLGNGIHCFFLQMNYYLVWTDINTGHLQSQACSRIKFSVL